MNEVWKKPPVSLETYQGMVGKEIGVSSWHVLDQGRINTYADVIEDHQFIHVDPIRAAETDFGGTVAHGMLTLSMMSGMAYGALPVMTRAKASINYGFDSVRFIAPVHSGKRIRGRFTLAEAQTRGRGDLMTRFAAKVEIEGADRPAVKADWLVLYQF